CWLPRRSWRLDHNQCCSLYYSQHALSHSSHLSFVRSPRVDVVVFPSSPPVPNRNCGYAFESLRNGPLLHGVERFAPAQGQTQGPNGFERSYTLADAADSTSLRQFAD